MELFHKVTKKYEIQRSKKRFIDVPKRRNRGENMQENFLGLKDMNFQTDRDNQVPNTMHENRPIVSTSILHFNMLVENATLKASRKEEKK